MIDVVRLLYFDATPGLGGAIAVRNPPYLGALRAARLD